MAVKEQILDFSEIDLNRVLVDEKELERFIPQRYEMQQLTAIVYEDPQRHICAGYKDVRDDEFWVRGHMPGMPLMPGVLMCEAAAQMCSYYTRRYGLEGSSILGFGGMDEIRFRGVVRPGSRMVVIAKLLKIRPGAMIVCRFQSFVEQSLVCEGVIKGIPLPNMAFQPVASRTIEGGDGNST